MLHAVLRSGSLFRMHTIIQHRLKEENTLLGGKVCSIEPGDNFQIPAIGSTIQLFSISDGFGEVISVDNTVEKDPQGTPKRRWITLVLKRI